MSAQETNKEECQELKNIEYQTMLLNKTSNSNNELRPKKEIPMSMNEMNTLLENEKKEDKKVPWSKLTKSDKNLKVNIYLENISIKHDLSSDELGELKKYMTKCIERKMIQKSKVITYDKEKGEITDIPGLTIFDKDKVQNVGINKNKRFTLKLTDKKSSTLKNLSKGNSVSKKDLVNKIRSKNKKGKDKHKIDV